MDIRARMNQIDEFANERWLGISTNEHHPQHDTNRPDFRGYSPTSYRDWRVIRRHLAPQGSFIDYGAGLGRVTILAARLPFSRVIGVDLDYSLVERGNQNIRCARGLKCPAEILCCDATDFYIPSDASTLYLANPFSGDVLAAVLANVRRLGRNISLVCNLPRSSGFEHEIRKVSWLALQTNIGLSDGRKCLIYAPPLYH
jgi:SAM-dependent methyltransferase